MKSRNYIIAIPPGATIAELLENYGMSQKEFAFRMDMSEEQICSLLKGELRLTSDIANKLERVFGVPSKFWNNLETIYNEKLQIDRGGTK